MPGKFEAATKRVVNAANATMEQIARNTSGGSLGQRLRDMWQPVANALVSNVSMAHRGDPEIIALGDDFVGIT
jgi:hypothetical protein